MLRGKTIVLATLALAAAGAAGLLAQNWLAAQRAHLAAEFTSKSQPEQEREPSVEILVAAETLPTGAFIKAKHMTWVSFPKDSALESYFRRDKFEDGELDGAVARSSLAAGEPITQAKVVRPGERGFLAAVLKAGKRAVSVPINATTGISGFVFPGDTVDLLLTMTLTLDGRERRATETVLRDIRVLAVDQRTNDQEGEPALAKTATLEVDSKQAELIAVAMEMGKLSLALRSLADDSGPDGSVANLQELQANIAPSFTWDNQAASFMRRPEPSPEPSTEPNTKPSPPPSTKVRVVRRNESETLSFPSGAQ